MSKAMEESKLKVTITRLHENSIYVGHLCTPKNNVKKKRNLAPVTISQLMKKYSAYDFEIFRLSVCFY